MDFHFGINWANYSRFFGDVFGNALAAEGIFAFFLESGFLAIVAFGRSKVSAGLKPKAQKLLEIIREDPFQKQPNYEKLIGDLVGAYSRRINIQHRVVYQVYQQEHIIKILRLWTHYE